MIFKRKERQKNLYDRLADDIRAGKSGLPQMMATLIPPTLSSVSLLWSFIDLASNNAGTRDTGTPKLLQKPVFGEDGYTDRELYDLKCRLIDRLNDSELKSARAASTADAVAGALIAANENPAKLAIARLFYLMSFQHRFMPMVRRVRLEGGYEYDFGMPDMTGFIDLFCKARGCDYTEALKFNRPDRDPDEKLTREQAQVILSFLGDYILPYNELLLNPNKGSRSERRKQAQFFNDMYRDLMADHGIDVTPYRLAYPKVISDQYLEDEAP